jgi:hypothetical protein
MTTGIETVRPESIKKCPFFSSSHTKWRSKVNFPPNLCKFWRVLQGTMLVYFTAIWSFFGHLVYFVATWSIMWPFGLFCCHLVYFMFIWYICPVLVCCSKKNLATLTVSGVDLTRASQTIVSFFTFIVCRHCCTFFCLAVKNLIQFQTRPLHT